MASRIPPTAGLTTRVSELYPHIRTDKQRSAEHRVRTDPAKVRSKVAATLDAVGRRVENPRSGIYFVREAQAQAVRKVVIQR